MAQRIERDTVSTRSSKLTTENNSKCIHLLSGTQNQDNKAFRLDVKLKKILKDSSSKYII